MNKIFMYIALLYAALCPLGVFSQGKTRQVISMDEMFSLADRNSKSLRADATGISEAQAAVKVARSARLPEIEASISVSYLGNGYLFDRNFSNGMTAPIPHFGNNFAMEASQIIYSGGAITTQIAIAGLQEENARLTLDNKRNSIRFQLAGYYLELFKQQNILQVYEKNIEQAKQVLKDIKAKEDEGVVLKNDITRYELLLSNLELVKTQIQNTLTILNSNLTSMLGLPANTVIEPDTTILSKMLPVENNEYWTEIGLDRSSALKQLSLVIQIREYEDKIIKSKRLPSIALIAGNHFDGPLTVEVPPLNKNLNYWYVGIGMQYSLSSLYKTRQSLSKNKFAIQRAEECYEEAKEQTELAIKADYIRYLEAYEQLNTRQKDVELARQNYSVICNRYKNGTALLTDILDAGNTKLSAEMQAVNTQINIVFIYFKLLYISGTLSN
ncbi:MAG: TolC family protein [Bacteroidales bacterium]|jgi:outer membrane protein TolC|nr:TolC family protein [Bacteroidales bacterium]